MLAEKDAIISLMRDEISRKNVAIRQLIEKQDHMEEKLHKIQSVLSFDEDDLNNLVNGNNAGTGGVDCSAKTDSTDNTSPNKISEDKDDEDLSLVETPQQIQSAAADVADEYK